LWLPIIKQIIKKKIASWERIYLVLDRTQWKDKNLFMVGVVIGKRAVPVYWQFLNKKGASNLAEQQAILRPALKLLKNYQIIVLGDREFHSGELASWLIEEKVEFVFRQKKSANIKQKGQEFQSLNEFSIKPGERRFFPNIKVGKEPQITGLSMGIYWRRKYRGMGELEPWYLLTNLPNLLIAIAYTHSTLKGQSIRRKNQIDYIGRMRKVKQTMTKNSNFWVGLYGSSWVVSSDFLRDWVEKIMRINLNKLPFYQRGQQAMFIIQQAV